jgi:hypothetical protein
LDSILRLLGFSGFREYMKGKRPNATGYGEPYTILREIRGILAARGVEISIWIYTVLRAYFVFSLDYATFVLILGLVGVARCILLCRVCSIYRLYNRLLMSVGVEKKGEDNDNIIYFLGFIYFICGATGGEIDLMSFWFTVHEGNKKGVHPLI